MLFCLRTLFRLMIVVSLFAAITTVGFAHKTSVSDIDPDLLAYVAAGGALEDICGASDDAPHGMTRSCDACRLVDTADCPPHSAALRHAAMVHTRQLQHVAQLRHHAKPLDAAQQTRAPPHA